MPLEFKVLLVYLYPLDLILREKAYIYRYVCVYTSKATYCLQLEKSDMPNIDVWVKNIALQMGLGTKLTIKPL